MEDPAVVEGDQEFQAPVTSQLIAEQLVTVLGTQKTGHPKLESALYQLSVIAAEQGSVAAQAFSQERGIRGISGQIQVVVEMEPGQVIASSGPRPLVEPDSEDLRQRRSALVQRLQGAGHTIEAEYRNLVRVRAFPERLQQLASQIPGVRYVRLPLRPVPAAVISEGVALTGAATNYHDNGFTGAGVTIAIIDGGFDNLTETIANGDLPGTVMSRDCTVAGCTGTGAEIGTEHGTAVAEIVYDMAPGATLWLLKTQFAMDVGIATDFAISQGVKIITMSLGFPGDGFVENQGMTDIIANDARNDHGILWVNSAGNEANGDHWRGQFVDTVDIFLPPFDALHEFSTGVDELNSFNASVGDTVCVWLTWNDWPVSDQNYDIGLLDSTLTLVNGSGTLQTGTQPPLEAFCHIVPAGSGGTHHLLIQNAGASGTATFELYKSGGSSGLQYSVADHSILPPADATGVIAVGAIDKDKWTIVPHEAEAFSSRGPTNDGRTKPDIMGPDRTASFTFDSPFFAGTSASAPHVAGGLALLMEANLTFTPDQIKALLLDSAIPMGVGDPNNIFGHGRMALPPPPEPVTLGVSVNPTSWPIIGPIPGGIPVQMDETTDVTVTNTGNVTETFTLRVADSGPTWMPGAGAGTESFLMQGLFVGSADAPAPADFQADDALFSSTAVESTASQFGMGLGGPGFNPDAGGVLTTNLVAYWKLDESSGTRVDSIGTNDLTDNNTVTSATGKQGNAAQFTKANTERLTLADNTAMSVGDEDFSFAAWVYLDTISTSMGVLSKLSGLGSQEYEILFDDSNGQFLWRVWDGITTVIGSIYASTFGTVPTGEWIFIVVWHDSVTNQVRISINDGTPDTAATTGVSGDGTTTFVIGDREDADTPWNGRIDEVGFWKQVLTAQERTDLYNGGSGNTFEDAVPGINGVGVPAAGTRDLWLSFTGPTETAETGQQSIVLEIGAVQTP